MITIKDFMETVSYRITDGSEYQWACYGKNARTMDYWNQKHNDGVSVGIVFDTITQTVYQMEAWDYANRREYRWIHPDYIDAFAAEAKQRNVDFEESIDGNTYIDLDVPEDMLEKATAIANGEEYDDRIQVPLLFNDSEMLQLMTYAHEADMSLNQFVEYILLEKVKQLQEQPTWP